jgi:PST family polysaccharide transporter
MQKERTIADQVNTWLGAGLSIVLALFGWGAMSLAVGRVVASIVFAILLWRWSPVPYRFGWDRTLIGRLMRFGLPLAASSVVLFAASYADQIIIGATLGAQALGFYVLAFNLASWPLTIFSMPLRAVAPAAFSAIKHDSPRMSRNYARIFALLMSVALPACLAISGASDPVIRFVYGAAWSDSGPILMWLALLIAFKIGFELAYDYLVVLGKSGWIFATQAVSLVTAVPAMLLAASPFGAPGVAAAQVAVAAVILMPIYAAQLHRMGVRVATSVRAVLLPTCVGIVVWVASRLFAESVPIAFVAAALAALVSVLGIAVAVYPRRDTVRLFRSSMSGGGAS